MNLRSAYFSSGWKGRPTVLFWGNSTGMQDLRDLLRGSSWGSKPLGDICEAADGRTITLLAVSDRRETGIHVLGIGMEWRLTSSDAEDFADRFDSLASSPVAAHQYLDAYGSTIAVEASLDEYSDNLRPK